MEEKIMARLFRNPSAAVFALASAVLLLALFACAPAYARSVEAQQFQEQMIYPAVQVFAKGGTGSGTVIFSGERDGEVETYVLTNNHVIGDQVRLEDKFENNEDVKKEEAGYYTVSIPQYADGSRYIGTVQRRGVLVRRDSAVDLAVLKLTDDVNAHPYVAKIAAEDTEYQIGERAIVVGGGFGHTPFATEGFINPNHVVTFDGRERVQISAPVVPGNSGGGLYQKIGGSYQLVGVPNISTQNAWHVAFAVKLPDVHAFLRAAELGFIVETEVIDAVAPGVEETMETVLAELLGPGPIAPASCPIGGAE
jgi:S1-C subfamily serine protease